MYISTIVLLLADGTLADGALLLLMPCVQEVLLDLLEREQSKERERDMMLSSVQDPQERARLDKIFDMERAKAREIIEAIKSYAFHRSMHSI